VAQQHVPVPPLLFISYSHKDRTWLDEVRKYLDVFEEQQLVHIWDDTRIEPGVDWLPAIENALQTARAALLLVTQDFVISPFIKRKELPSVLQSARTRGCVLLWVSIRASTFEMTPLGGIQAIGDPSRPLAGMKKPQREIVYKKVFVAVRDALLHEEAIH
jgi:hypothetical protein